MKTLVTIATKPNQKEKRKKAQLDRYGGECRVVVGRGTKMVGYKRCIERVGGTLVPYVTNDVAYLGRVVTGWRGG